MVLLRCTLHWTGILGGNGRRCAIDVDVDFIVLFMFTIALSFIGNVLLGIAIWCSRTLPKWAGVIWLVWAALFYVAGILYGFLFTGSSPPTQPIGSLLMAIMGVG